MSGQAGQARGVVKVRLSGAPTEISRIAGLLADNGVEVLDTTGSPAMIRLRVPLVTGTVLSLAAVSAWSYMAALSAGPAAPLQLTWRHPVASYMALAGAPTGNGFELFAVVVFIYFACFLVAGWRHARRRPLRDIQPEDEL